MKTITMTKLFGLIILIFIILFVFQDLFEYSLTNKYHNRFVQAVSKDSIGNVQLPIDNKIDSTTNTTSLIIDVLNSSINVTIVLISIFLAIFIFVLGYLLNSMEKSSELNSKTQNDKMIQTIDFITSKMKSFESEVDAKMMKIEETLSFKMKSFNDYTEDKIKVISEKTKILEGQIDSLDLLKREFVEQNKFIAKSVNYIYSGLNLLADKNKDKILINRILDDAQALRLYSTKKDERIAALHYFSERGTKIHLEDIQYISKNDLYEEIRNHALIVLGRIEERENPQNDTMNS